MKCAVCQLLTRICGMYVQLRATIFYKQPDSYAELFLQASLSQHLAARLCNPDSDKDFLDVVSLLEITLINEASPLLSPVLLDHPLSSHLHSPTSAFALFARLHELSTHLFDAVHVADSSGLSDLISTTLDQIDSLERDYHPRVELVSNDASISPSTESRTMSDDTPTFVSFSEYMEFALTEWHFRLVIFRTILQWAQTNGTSLIPSVIRSFN